LDWFKWAEAQHRHQSASAPSNCRAPVTVDASLARAGHRAHEAAPPTTVTAGHHRPRALPLTLSLCHTSSKESAISPLHTHLAAVCIPCHSARLGVAQRHPPPLMSAPPPAPQCRCPRAPKQCRRPEPHPRAAALKSSWSLTVDRSPPILIWPSLHLLEHRPSLAQLYDMSITSLRCSSSVSLSNVTGRPSSIMEHLLRRAPHLPDASNQFPAAPSCSRAHPDPSSPTSCRESAGHRHTGAMAHPLLWQRAASPGCLAPVGWARPILARVNRGPSDFSFGICSRLLTIIGIQINLIKISKPTLIFQFKHNL
jgi:hypothetical protein